MKNNVIKLYCLKILRLIPIFSILFMSTGWASKQNIGAAALEIGEQPKPSQEQTVKDKQSHLPLNLSEAVEIALSNNLHLKIERISPKIQKNSLESAKSIFDPSFNVSSSLSDKKTRPKSTETETLETTFEASAHKKFIYGTNVSVSYLFMDTNEKTILPGDQDSQSALTSLVISQPLLKNRGIAVNQRSIILSENNLKKSRLELKQAIIDMVAQTQNLYWQVYSAKESLVVQQKSLQLAQRFLEEVNAKIRVGVAAHLDALQAKAEVASIEERVIISENTLLNLQETFLNYIYGAVSKQKNIHCKERPYFKPLDLDENKSIDEALIRRTNYLSAKLDLDSAQTDLSFYKNQKLPDLKLNATAKYYEGMSDIEFMGNDPYQDYYSGGLSVSLEFPWGLRNDLSNYRSALLKRKQIQILLKETEAQIVLEVRQALRNVRAGHKRYEASTLAKKLAEEKLKAENEKYHKGLSTSYNVLLYQRDLTDAMVNWVEATINYQVAIIDLYKSVGITLEKNNIKFEEASL